MKLKVHFDYRELNSLQYPIVVQNYDRIKTGSGKRKFHAAFQETERRKVRTFYNLFYRWYLVAGTPDEHSMSLSDFEFAKRVVDFFAGV